MHYSLSLQNMVVLPPNFSWKWCIQNCHHLAQNASAIKAPTLSRQVRAHTYIKYNRGEFWYPYSIGSMWHSTFPNPNKFICKIWSMYSIISKSCKVALTSTMCTSVHMSIHSVVCMNRRNLFLSKYRFQPCMVQCTMAQSGAQTIKQSS